MASELHLIVISVLVPLLAISWLCCMAYCIYRSLVRNLSKRGRTTRVQVLVTDNVRRQSSSSDLTSSLSRSRNNGRRHRSVSEGDGVSTVGGVNSTANRRAVPGAVGNGNDDSDSDDNDPFANSYGPVMAIPRGLEQSLRSQGKSLSDSLGPTYYPKHPQDHHGVGGDGGGGEKRAPGSASGGRPETPAGMKPSPIAPLQAPWPHLPPISKQYRGNGRYSNNNNNGGGNSNSSRMPTSVRNFLENYS